LLLLHAPAQLLHGLRGLRRRWGVRRGHDTEGEDVCTSDVYGYPS
jgi:hypothetical protein